MISNKKVVDNKVSQLLKMYNFSLECFSIQILIREISDVLFVDESNSN
jgi:hypothetical protein